MKLTIIISLFISQLFCQSAFADTGNKKITASWDTFIKALEKKNIEALVSLSTSRIKCYDCLDNTPKEAKELSEFRNNDSDWYEKLYSEKVYIDSKLFYKDDFPIFFTPEFIIKLKTGKTLFLKTKEQSIDVLVTTIKRDELFPGHEGGQHVFSFKKILNEYKFSGLSTIP